MIERRECPINKLPKLFPLSLKAVRKSFESETLPGAPQTSTDLSVTVRSAHRPDLIEVLPNGGYNGFLVDTALSPG